MGAMSQLHADTQDHLEQIKILKNELRIAVRRLETAADHDGQPRPHQHAAQMGREAREALEDK